MGQPKKSSKKLQTQMRPRNTRSSKGRLLSDPMYNTELLTEQLRSLGLYAAPTVGDGNCLFRALSDQLYGTPSRHPQLRQDICNWIAHHKSRYEPFVEDERGIDEHLRCMRENATYGGHMELSAFAHLMRRNVKVIQPGLVYVIEWAAGGALSSPTISRSASSSTSSLSSLADSEIIDVDAADSSPEPQDGTVYVAYHDWEHFSSIRNLKGPHTGLPSVRETISYPYPSEPSTSHADPKQSKADAKERKRLEREAKDRAKAERQQATLAAKPKIQKVRLKLSSASPVKSTAPQPPPSPGRLRSSSSASGTSRVQRSPKRSFDESSGSAGSESESVAKRTRSSYAPAVKQETPEEEDEDVEADEEMDSGEEYADDDDDEEGEAEDLNSGNSGTSLSLSPPALSSCSSLSSLSSLSPSPPPEPIPIQAPVPAPAPVPAKLTRRQRKALGLPKTRVTAAAAKSAGKIIIPGGRYDQGTGEWQRNGTGRVDVRGFRELKI
ncbi:unnamed protein product [Mycena citricolor]|uniref:OTU domain-containing protein n=1 Tax=Mycena citricolor TaxID=2018698 RepID=A0AAD2H8T1_9AGAR|nr:unnamed protein product [Mycena citricolor]